MTRPFRLIPCEPTGTTSGPALIVEDPNTSALERIPRPSYAPPQRALKLRELRTSPPRLGSPEAADALGIDVFAFHALERGKLALESEAEWDRAEQLLLEAKTRKVEESVRRPRCLRCGEPMGQRIQIWLGTPPPGWRPGEPAPHVCPPAPALVPWESEPRFVLLMREHRKQPIYAPTHLTLRGLGRLEEREPCPPFYVVERRHYQSPLLGWCDEVYATEADHAERVLPLLQAAEAVLLLFLWLWLGSGTGREERAG